MNNIYVHPKVVAGPDGSFVSTGTFNLEVPGSNSGRAEYFVIMVVYLQ